MAIKRPRAIADALIDEPERERRTAAGNFFGSREEWRPSFFGRQGKKVSRRRCVRGDRGEAGPRPDQAIRGAISAGSKTGERRSDGDRNRQPDLAMALGTPAPDPARVRIPREEREEPTLSIFGAGRIRAPQRKPDTLRVLTRDRPRPLARSAQRAIFVDDDGDRIALVASGRSRRHWMTPSKAPRLRAGRLSR